ncbi:hypothetical protein CHS0354_021813 [Potamilus streckersoni]|uniref:Phosphatidic acid phosphatase type 2/haloperoxidase domain-containing protein n=1 Tax=Potamilus streckersoni TaxID=2493646 RepID=A0AAE0S3V7_9BIVA|nr:hypothetical protein CHS0354_021813 [Potamilus streckersoni]
MKGCVRKRTVPYFLNVQLAVDIIIWLAIGIPLLILFLKGYPYQAGFFCDDTSLKYPYKPSTISDVLIFGMAFGITTISLLSVEILNRLEKKTKNKRCLSADTLICLKGFGIFLFGFAIAQLFNEVLKNAVGRLRPNFFDVCRPNFFLIDCSHGYITNYTCTNTEHSGTIMRNSRQSFPSGHAVFSMFTAMYLTLYIQIRLNITYSRILKPTLQAVLMLLSLLCSASRITDHMHHSSDVIAGLILGFIVACAVFYSLGTKYLNNRNEENEDINDDIEENANPTSKEYQIPLKLPHENFTDKRRPPSFSLKQKTLASNPLLV